MSSATLQMTANTQYTHSDGFRGASSLPRSAVTILRTAIISPELRLSHLRAQTREWLVVHGADCAPHVLTDHRPDDPNTRTVPIVVFAPTSEERDHLLHQLSAHVAATLCGHADPVPGSQVIEVQELRIDRDAHRVTVGGNEIPLPLLQFKLLVALAERRGRVQSRSVLLREVWGIRETTPTRTVDTHVKRLRDRLRGAGRFIQSIRGVGYRFSEIPRLSET